MTPEFASKLDALFRTYLVPLGWHLLGAVAVWIVGGWVINLIRAAFNRALRMRRVDTTLCSYLDASANIGLRVLLLIAVLGILGIQTTSFAALIAAAGIAVGAAWAGLLSNFAAGLFLLTFRPFKVGDFIAAGGTSGTVREIGLFVTSIDTPDRVLTFVGNNKLFSDNVKEMVQSVPNVLNEPEPSVEILTLSAVGTTLTVRPYCHTEHYWQVYFDTNRLISELFGAPVAIHAT
jgi:small conductance mechanosensitive channel